MQVCYILLEVLALLYVVRHLAEADRRIWL